MASLPVVYAREMHYVHSASLAYEDGIVFMSEPSAARQAYRLMHPQEVHFDVNTGNQI